MKISCGDLGVVGTNFIRMKEQGSGSTPSRKPPEGALASLNSLALALSALRGLRVFNGTLSFLWVKD